MEPTTDFQTDGLKKKKFTHDWFNFAFVFVSVVAYIILQIFNLASSPLGLFKTVFYPKSDTLYSNFQIYFRGF